MQDKVNLPYFLARRLSRKSPGGGNNVMIRVATISVAIGMAVMILAICVIHGFKQEIGENLTGFDSHIQITHLSGNNSLETLPINAKDQYITAIQKLENCRNVHRYAIKAGILSNDNSMQGVVLKGVGGDFDWSFFAKKLVEGELPRIIDTLRTRDVLMSESLAKTMQLKVGEQFEILFIDPVRSDKFKLSGIYRSEFSDMDKLMIMTDIRNIQRINGWADNQISGYGISGYSIDDIASLSSGVYGVVSSNMDETDSLMVVDLRNKNVMIFDWLATHDLNALIIIVIMLIVSIFNIAAALLIILLEKSSFIGVMKALGMSNSALQKTFVLRSAKVIVNGLLWGNVVGITLCILQKYTGLVTLDASGYFLSEVPIYIDWIKIVMLNIGVFVVILVSQLLPTMMISKIVPEKTIKYE